MKIEIPEEYYPYLKMLVRATTYPDMEVALLRVFDTGLDEGEFDAALAREPDIFPDFLAHIFEAPKVAVDIPTTPEQVKRLESVSKGYRFSVSETATVTFLQGLFEHYLFLKGSSLYEADEVFHGAVDRMPHDVCYDNEEDFMHEDDTHYD
jgi:hypothetical protein